MIWQISKIQQFYKRFWGQAVSVHMLGLNHWMNLIYQHSTEVVIHRTAVSTAIKYDISSCLSGALSDSLTRRILEGRTPSNTCQVFWPPWRNLRTEFFQTFQFIPSLSTWRRLAFSGCILPIKNTHSGINKKVQTSKLLPVGGVIRGRTGGLRIMIHGVLEQATCFWHVQWLIIFFKSTHVWLRGGLDWGFD